MTKTTQTLPNEKILSIRRAIETKKKEERTTAKSGKPSAERQAHS